jgi:hypothetical protein
LENLAPDMFSNRPDSNPPRVSSSTWFYPKLFYLVVSEALLPGCIRSSSTWFYPKLFYLVVSDSVIANLLLSQDTGRERTKQLEPGIAHAPRVRPEAGQATGHQVSHVRTWETKKKKYNLEFSFFIVTTNIQCGAYILFLDLVSVPSYVMLRVRLSEMALPMLEI